MKLSTSTVTKIVISDTVQDEGVGELDPIALYLEDTGKGSGKVVITCFDSSWTHYWSHMGEQHNLTSFMLGASNDYLAGKFMGSRRDTEPDVEATIKHARAYIIAQRRETEFSKEIARELYDDVGSETSLPTEFTPDAKIWEDIFGPEFWHDFKYRPSSDWVYLNRIITAIKLALKELQLIAQDNS